LTVHYNMARNVFPRDATSVIMGTSLGETAVDDMEERRQSAAAGSVLIKGAAVLAAAAVISKLLGTMQKIPLQNLAGDGVFGIYNAVYPVYILILTLATAGFPIAVSTFVSEQMVRGRADEARRTLRIAASVLAGTGLIFFVLLFFGADWLAGLIGVRQASPSIRSVSFALLLVPVMAALRGYFQGCRNMVPTAVSQVVEQLVRVGTMVGLLLYFQHADATAGRIASGATFGSVTGAAAGLLVMLLYWRRELRDRSAAAPAAAENDTPEPAMSVVRRFVRYALPVCLGTIVLPVLTLVDTFTIPRLLKHGGKLESEAISLFGLYNHGQPLVQLITLIATSVSAAIVPAIAEARARGAHAAIDRSMELTVRLAWLIGLAASGGLAVAAVPLNQMFYLSAAGSDTMAILAFTALFATVNIVSGSILVGFGAVMAPARNLLIAAVLKAGLNIVLMPVWGINGAAVATVIAYMAACVLNLVELRRLTGYRPAPAQSFGKPLMAAVVMCAAVAAVIFGSAALFSGLPWRLPPRAVHSVTALLGVFTGAVVYVLAVLRFGAVTRQDLESVPGMGSRLIRLLDHLRLLK
jgi:O-antigen/teichoic acid export membrane protein